MATTTTILLLLLACLVRNAHSVKCKTGLTGKYTGNGSILFLRSYISINIQYSSFGRSMVSYRNSLYPMYHQDSVDELLFFLPLNYINRSKAFNRLK